MAQYTIPPAGTVPVRRYLQELGLPDDLIRWNEQAQMVQVGNAQIRPEANIAGRTWANPTVIEQAARQAMGGQLPVDNPFAPPNPALGLMRAVAAASQMAQMMAPIARGFSGMPATIPQIQFASELTGRLPSGEPTFKARESEADRQLQERLARMQIEGQKEIARMRAASGGGAGGLSPSLQFSMWRYFDERQREQAAEEEKRREAAAADAAQTFGVAKSTVRAWQQLEPAIQAFKQMKPSGMMPDRWVEVRQRAYDDLVKGFADIKARYGLTQRDADFLDAMWSLMMGDPQAQIQARQKLDQLSKYGTTMFGLLPPQ